MQTLAIAAAAAAAAAAAIAAAAAAAAAAAVAAAASAASSAAAYSASGLEEPGLVEVQEQPEVAAAAPIGSETSAEAYFALNPSHQNLYNERRYAELARNLVAKTAINELMSPSSLPHDG